jgi:hypothetical protein
MSSDEVPSLPTPKPAIPVVVNEATASPAPDVVPSVALDNAVLQKIRIFLRAVGEAPSMTVEKFNIDGNKTIMDVSASNVTMLLICLHVFSILIDSFMYIYI